VLVLNDQIRHHSDTSCVFIYVCAWIIHDSITYTVAHFLTILVVVEPTWHFLSWLDYCYYKISRIGTYEKLYLFIKREVQKLTNQCYLQILRPLQYTLKWRRLWHYLSTCYTSNQGPCRPIYPGDEVICDHHLYE